MQGATRRIAVLATLLLAAASPPARAAISNATDGPPAGGGVDTGYALVQLRGDPLSISPRTHPPQGKKIDFDSSTVRAVRAELSALRTDF